MVDKTAKLADFGCSGVITQATSTTGERGKAAYMDPLSLKNESYSRGPKSDIFSLGVLLWEISSGEMPFKGCRETEIELLRFQGVRHDPVVGTPEGYIALYTECWDEMPDNRPSSEEVHRRLSFLSRRQPTVYGIDQ